MKSPTILLATILISITFLGYGQFTTIIPERLNNYSYKHSFSPSTFLIESAAVEFTMLDILKNNRIHLKSLPPQDNESETVFEWQSTDKKIKLVDKEQILTKQIMVMEKRIRGTALMHQTSEKYPQIVSAVPPNRLLSADFQQRPKSFGPLFKF